MKHASRLTRAVLGALFCAAAVSAGAQTATLNLLHGLNKTTDGSQPSAPLIQASDGNFYGVTQADGPGAAGTLFRYTPGTGGAAGTFKVLHSFNVDVDGSVSMTNAGLTEGPDGNLYGTTASGGGGNGSGNGVFFQVNLAKGTYSVLHNFTFEESYQPSTLTLGSDGNFYATTLYGGENSNGSILQITTAGAVTVLYNFPGGANGSNPQTSLLETSPLTFYSTNLGGDGLIFKAVVSGGTATVTAPFGFSGTNGASPNLPLIEYSDGNLYSGTNQGGAGADGGVGTIYKYNPSTNALTTLYDLSTDIAMTGQYPNALVLGSDGNFYFPTIDSATDCSSSINKITPAGALTTVYDGNTDAARAADILHCPASGLVQGSDGNYYGTSQGGGSANDYGDLFQMVPSSAQKAPVQLTASTTSPVAGTPFTLSYAVTNGFSVSAQQCYAFVQGGAKGAGTWTGKQAGKQGTSGWNGSASVTPVTAGTYTYALTCAGTESGFVTLTVGQGTTQKATSSISITSINSPNYQGQLTIALQVASASGSGTAPTGTVTFVAGTSTLGTVALTPGSGDLSTATLSIKDPLSKGTYALKISYSGDANYSASSVGGNLTIAAITSDVSINSVNSPQYKASAAVNLTIASASGSGPAPTGTITITIGGSTGSAVFTIPAGGSGDSYTGTATFATAVTPGTYSIQVTYSGDNTYSASSAGGNITFVNDTTTAQVLSPYYVRVGDGITLYGKVISSYAVPTGSIQFLFDNQPVGSPVALQQSVLFPNTAVAYANVPASLTGEGPVGQHSVAISYVPAKGSFFSSSATSGIAINLLPGSDALTPLSFSITPRNINPGGTITLQSKASLTSTSSPGYFLYTVLGEVIYLNPVNTAGSDGNGGVSVPVPPYIPAGSYTLTSTYTGDSKNPASSANATLTVPPLFASASPNPVNSGASITLNAYAAFSGSSFPTGSVNFAITAPGGTSPFIKFSEPLNASGVATTGAVATDGIGKGPYTVSASYNGDSSHAASSYTFTVTVQ